MIDTDEYEGHTPAPWDYEYGPTVSEHIDDADILTIKTEATFDEDKAWVNQRLAADAPLLLAEVKRLRSIVDDLYAYIVSDADISWSTIEDEMDWREEE